MSENIQISTVCLVTNEIYPFAPGGIGRLVSNWIIQNKEIDRVNIHLLLPQEMNSMANEIRKYVADYDVTVHFCDSKDLCSTEFGTLISQSEHNNWNYLQAYYVSYSYFSKLKDLEGHGIIFDVVEFPDYGGWGAVSIEAKRANVAFRNTKIAIRLHSTFGIIVKHEEFYHRASGWHAGMVDLERFALEHADIVVGHIKEIVKKNMDFYRLSAEWFDNAIIETPPIYVEEYINYEELVSYQPVSRFIFSSRFQPFKRPDLFIKASCLYFERGNDGEALLISYGWDSSYIEWLQSLIPPNLCSKIRILTGLSHDERRSALANATIVIPSDYESYCLFAYESALQGNRILLRRSCVAFGQHEPWVDGSNCLMFGDEPESLALVMEESINWRPSNNLVTQHDIPYWNNTTCLVSDDNTKSNPNLTLHLFICDVEDAYTLEKCKNILREQSFDAATIFCTYFLHQEILALREEYATISIIQSAYGSLQMDEVYDNIKNIEEDIIVVCFASDLSNRMFCNVVKDVIKNNNSIDVVTSHDIIIDQHGVKSIQFTAGEQASCVLAGMPVVGRLVGFKREILHKINYEYALRSYGWQVFFQSICSLGTKICVLPESLNYTNFSANAKNLNIYYPTQLNRSCEESKIFASSYGLLLDRTEFIDNYRNVIVRDVDFHTPLVRVHPQEAEWWGDQVSFNPEKKQWLIHPIDKDIVIARLHLDRDLIASDAFFVDIKNHGVNFGVIINIYIGEFNREMLNSADWIKNTDKISNSVLIPSGETRRIVCSRKNMHLVSDLYIISRVPPGRSADNCWTMLARYGGLYL